MENNIEDTLMKSRSSSACIKSGYKLYIGNFRKIFKSSWLVALIYAVLCGIVATVCVIHIPRIIMQMMASGQITYQYATDYLGLITIVCVLVIIGGIVETAFYSCGMSLLRKHAAANAIPTPTSWFHIDIHITWRTIKAVLCNLLITTVLLLIFSVILSFPLKHFMTGQSIYVIALTATMLGVAITALLWLPLCFVSIKYIMCDDTRFWRLLGSGYKMGLRRYWFIFVVMLVSGIIVCVAEYVLQQPAFIIAMANSQANMGVINSDPLGMPSYIIPLTAITFFVAGFIQAYIRLTAFFTAYYMYGSIDTSEAERKQFKETALNQTN